MFETSISCFLIIDAVFLICPDCIYVVHKTPNGIILKNIILGV